MKKIQEKIEHMEQYDYVDDSYVVEVEDKYAPYIGIFLMRFSALEHSLNIRIANRLGDDWHSTGYMIIERLTISNKINLFTKLYSELLSFQGKKGKEKLKLIVKLLEDLNKFRNSIVHSNWATLDKEGYVRTRIEIDNDIGQVNFKKVKITKSIINQKISSVIKTIDSLETFSEKALRFGFEEKKPKNRQWDHVFTVNETETNRPL